MVFPNLKHMTYLYNNQKILKINLFTSTANNENFLIFSSVVPEKLKTKQSLSCCAHAARVFSTTVHICHDHDFNENMNGESISAKKTMFCD